MCLISILLISSCGANTNSNDQSGGNDESGGPTISITAPNDGVSFSTRQSDSLTLSGVCELGSEITLTTTPERTVTNNCAAEGTWSFETGKLSSGENTFAIIAEDSSGHISVKTQTIIADLAYSFTIAADTSTLYIGDTANLQVHFFDHYGAEIIVPEFTSSHSFTWSSDSSVVTVPTATPAAPGEQNIVIGASGCLSSSCVANVTATLSIDSAYGYPGNLTASIPITVNTVNLCASIKCAGGTCNPATGGCETTPGIAASMKIIADKSTIDCTAEIGGVCTAQDIANLHVSFYDATGAEIVMPEATTDHLISWSSDNPLIETVAVAVSSPMSGEDAIVTGVSGGTGNITATLSITNNTAYGYIGNTADSIPITVDGAVNFCATAKCGSGFVCSSAAGACLSTNALVTSSTYIVSAVTNGSGTITTVPSSTSKATFEGALTKGNINQTWNVGGLHDPVVTGDTLVVTAQDGVTIVTYTITVTAPSCTVGQQDPNTGGYVFYCGNAYSGKVGLEAAPSVPASVWSNVTSTLVGTGTAIGTGQANTIAIIEQSGQTTSAALMCAQLATGGYNDWFLPSIGELELMNTASLQGVKGLPGGRSPYWSSSEADSSDAMTLLPQLNSTTKYSKSADVRFQCIRAF
jgi:hypothetical protein